MCQIISFIVAPGHIAHRAVQPTITFGPFEDNKHDNQDTILAFHSLLLKAKGIEATLVQDIV
jgi:hypothetical protein